MTVYVVECTALGVFGAYTTLELAQWWLIAEAKARGYSAVWQDESKRCASLDNGLFTISLVACIIETKLIDYGFPT